MPKKGGKNKKKGGAKPAAAAAVDKVADTAKTVVYVPRKKKSCGGRVPPVRKHF
jgi:hypothetical protein